MQMSGHRHLHPPPSLGQQQQPPFSGIWHMHKKQKQCIISGAAAKTECTSATYKIISSMRQQQMPKACEDGI